MSRWMKGAVAALAGGALAASWGNYRWHQGFTAGADATLCVMAHQIDGPAEAMKSDACQNIRGKEPAAFPHSLRPQGPPARGGDTSGQS